MLVLPVPRLAATSPIQRKARAKRRKKQSASRTDDGDDSKCIYFLSQNVDIILFRSKLNETQWTTTQLTSGGSASPAGTHHTTASSEFTLFLCECVVGFFFFVWWDRGNARSFDCETRLWAPSALLSIINCVFRSGGVCVSQRMPCRLPFLLSLNCVFLLRCEMCAPVK